MKMANGVTDSDKEREGLTHEPFELQPSMLDLVTELCPEHEAEEIWRVVGHSLVEQARDLLDEVYRALVTVYSVYDRTRAAGCYGVHHLEYTLCRLKFTWRYGDSYEKTQTMLIQVVRETKYSPRIPRSI